MKFEEAVERLVQEVLTTTDYHITSAGFANQRTWKSLFLVNNLLYEFYAYGYDNNQDWHVGFRDLENDTHGVTGSGGQFQVFSAVMEILRRFYKEVQPSNVYFMAVEPSRIRLYDRLIKWFASEFGYEDRSEPTDSKGKDYKLVRKDAATQENPTVQAAAESLLGEVLTTTDYEIKSAGRIHADSWEADFAVDGTAFRFVCYKENPLADSWVIYFKDKLDGYGVTGKGGQFKVFAAVMDLLRRFEKDVHPEKVTFTASPPSRIRLYDRLVKWFTSQFNYKETEGDGLVRGGYKKYYELERM